ncbi:MAG: serine/threonine protein kinase, partial [Kiritimatiellia bacterium]
MRTDGQPPTIPIMQSSPQRTFEVLDCLGQGGFGVVYRAVAVSPGGLRLSVAIKLLKDPSPGAIQRLRREARLLAALTHPSILQVRDLVVVVGRTALVTEYVEGIDLTEAFQLDSPPSARAVVESVGTIADALRAAWTTPHEGEPLHLVHRDIKPSNVRIGPHGVVKLLDFGIAWAGGAEQTTGASTRGNSFVGSVPFMSPERFGRDITTPQADIYALGCILFEGLTHEPLHHDVTLGEMALRAATAGAHSAYVEERLTTLSERLPPSLIELLRQMLATEVQQRPSAEKVAEACERLVDAMPGERLKSWARAREWSDAILVDGPLTGRTLTQGGTSDLELQRSEPAHRTDPRATATLSVHLAHAGPEVTANHEPKVISAPLRQQRVPFAVGIGAVAFVLSAAALATWSATSPQITPESTEARATEASVEQHPPVQTIDGSANAHSDFAPPAGPKPAAVDVVSPRPADKRPQHEPRARDPNSPTPARRSSTTLSNPPNAGSTPELDLPIEPIAVRAPKLEPA